MLDLSKEEKCLNLEKLLDIYAQKTKFYHQKRRHFFANGGSRFQVGEYMAKDVESISEAGNRFSNRCLDYIHSFENSKDKQQVAGHFLWYIVKKGYLYSDFKSNALHTCAYLFNELSDDDKIKFMELLFKENGKKPALWTGLHDADVLKLANFEPNKNIEAVNRLYAKTLSHIASMPRKSPNLDDKIKLLNTMFNKFANNIQEISPEAAVRLADIHFNLQEKTDISLDSPITTLAQKTPRANMLAEKSSSTTAYDKNVIKAIFKRYVAHVNATENKKINENLFDQMERIPLNIDYTNEEMNELLDIIKPNETQRKNKKSESLTSLAEKLKGNIQKKQDNLYANINRKDSQQQYNQNVLKYAINLFAKAQKDTTKNINMSYLYEQLTQDGNINKPLLLNIVDAYGTSLTKYDLNDDDYHKPLHKAMSHMLQNIVVDFDYSSKDLLQLQQHIQQGADNHEEFEYMGEVVARAPSLSDDWRMQLRKSQKIKPLILRTNTGAEI